MLGGGKETQAQVKVNVNKDQDDQEPHHFDEAEDDPLAGGQP